MMIIIIQKKDEQFFLKPEFELIQKNLKKTQVPLWPHPYIHNLTSDGNSIDVSNWKYDESEFFELLLDVFTYLKYRNRIVWKYKRTLKELKKNTKKNGIWWIWKSCRFL